MHMNSILTCTCAELSHSPDVRGHIKCNCKVAQLHLIVRFEYGADIREHREWLGLVGKTHVFFTYAELRF